MMRVVESIYNADRTRRVDIFERGDGTYGFEEWRYGEEERSWMTGGRHAASFTDSAAGALSEARGRVRWLSELSGEWPRVTLNDSGEG